MSDTSKKLCHIAIDGISIEGMLELPANPIGLVLFAHGSGSSRLSPRNNYVASVLRNSHIATLLVDLLTQEEDLNYATRFDISLLTSRLQAVTKWIKNNSFIQNLPIGYFGASTGAAAALQAAAMEENISAVVSRGGRPDLAGISALEKINCPTLLIVGGSDDVVIELNQQAYAHMSCEKQLVIIPGATHLFDEEGTLEEVAKLAASFFEAHLVE